MKKQTINMIILANICIFIMLAYICYKIVINESKISALEENLVKLSDEIKRENEMPVEKPPEPEPVIIEAEKAKFRLYITGEVNKPGIYEAEEGSRIADLVEIAGGVTENADAEAVNMAAYLEDGRHVRIPAAGEVPEGETEPVFADNSNEAQDNESGTEDEYYKPEYTGPVNINTDGEERLMSLPGIGQATARNIINYREQNGPFKSKEDIKNVYRIGDAIYNSIADMIVAE